MRGFKRKDDKMRAAEQVHRWVMVSDKEIRAPRGYSSEAIRTQQEGNQGGFRPGWMGGLGWERLSELELKSPFHYCWLESSDS